MSTESWRGGVNKVLYALETTVHLDEANASIMADAMIERRYFVDGPQFFLDVIRDALSTDAVIITDEWAEPPYGREDLRRTERDIRRFLALVAQNLHERQPWTPAADAER